MPKKITPSLEDYLEAIYVLSKSEEGVRVTDIARSLCIAKSSVHIAMHSLKDAGYITQEHYGLIELTQSGERAAKTIEHKHEVIRSFLQRILGVPESIAEDEACKIEHVISDDTVSRMERFANDNRKD